jgi:hypothetical protein
MHENRLEVFCVGKLIVRVARRCREFLCTVPEKCGPIYAGEQIL